MDGLPVVREIAWNKFKKWIYAIIIVKFDIELGQTIEHIFPKFVSFTESQKNHISFLALPDSNSSINGDISYHFRILLDSENHGSDDVIRDYNGYLYGFVLFRQQKDSQALRGYFQKSIIVLTPHNFFPLFYHIVALLGPFYFTNGVPALESASNEMDHWPDPECGKNLSLPFLGQIFECFIPYKKEEFYSKKETPIVPCDIKLLIHGETSVSKELNNNNINETNLNPNDSIAQNHHTTLNKTCANPNEINPSNTNGGGNVKYFHRVKRSANIPFSNSHNAEIAKLYYENSVNCNIKSDSLNNHHIFLPNLYYIDIYKYLAPVISQIYLLWELVITCQPILVISNIPTISSNVVDILVSLIEPLQYGSEWRPYFTIHDSDAKAFLQHKDTYPPSVIFGVTNLYFAKNMQHWPHILRIIDLQPSSNKKSNIRKAKPVKPFENKNGLYTKYKPYLHKDKAFILKLQSQTKSNEIKNGLISKELENLTRSFLIPLDQYMHTLMPHKNDILPHKKIPTIKTFNTENFILYLQHYVAHHKTPLNGDWKNLYRKFLATPNFYYWFEDKTHQLQSNITDILSQKILGLKDFSKNPNDYNANNLLGIISPKLIKKNGCSENFTLSETIIVDAIINFTEKMKYFKSSPGNYHRTILKLEYIIHGLKNYLPQDLKLSIKNTSNSVY